MSEQRVPTVPPASRADIARWAEWLIRRTAPHLLHQPGRYPVLEVFDNIEKHVSSLTSGVDDLGPGIEGCCTPDGQVLLSETTYKNLIGDVGRARFTAVHEICHGLHHRQHVKQILIEGRVPTLYRRSAIPPYVNPEWQADEFASAVLMPAPALRQLAAGYPAGLSVGYVSGVFDVSYSAAKYRLEKLGIPYLM